MQIILTVSVFVLLLVSCKETAGPADPAVANGNDWSILLGKGLGSCTISLPKNFDTLFTWTQHSDCGDPCARLAYRIQPRHFPVFKETGFYYLPLQDSVEQFTVKHAKLFFPIVKDDTFLARQLSSHMKKEAFENR